MKNRLIIIAILISLVPALGISMYSYYFTDRLLDKNVRKELKKETDFAYDNHIRFVEERFNNVVLWSQLNTPKVALDFKRPEGLITYLNSLTLQYKAYKDIIVLDDQFQYFAINTKNKNRKEINRAWDKLLDLLPEFQRVARELKKSKKQAIAINRGIQNGMPQLFVVSKILDDKRNTMGYFVTRVASDALQKPIMQMTSRLQRYGFKTLMIKFVTPKDNHKQNDHFLYCTKSTQSNHPTLFVKPLCLSVDNDEIRAESSRYGLIIFISLIVLLLLFSVVFRKLVLNLTSPLNEFLVHFQKIAEGKSEKITLDSNYSEVNELTVSANRIIQRLKDYQRDLEDKAKAIATATLASQVTHDIRSPLAALEVITKDLGNLPEEKRLMVRRAINRIRDIANSLLVQYRSEENRLKAEKTKIHEPHTIQLLSSLIDNLITEKRLQYRSKLNIEIEFSLDKDSYGLFAKIQPKELERLLSNLINNAVEAFEQKGLVKIELKSNNKSILIRIKDNGKGIAPEILSNLMRKGVTHGKKGGSGLGLYHARKTMKACGGEIKLESTLGKGTSVILLLPRQEPPKWFVDRLRLVQNSAVVILDDDTLIHQIWQGRFEFLKIDEYKIKVFNFFDPEKFSNWIINESASYTDVLFLIDYEFLNYQETGLDLIKKHHLNNNAILVTSRYEEKSIMEHCESLGVRLIPKGIAGFVPILFFPCSRSYQMVGEKCALDANFSFHSPNSQK